MTDGTDDTDSEGEEKAAKAKVHNPLLQEHEFKKVFKGKRVHEAVLEVVCRLARLMGKLCGDNAAPGAMTTDEDVEELQQEAKLFVTRFVRVLFGAVNTTKMHRLAFHLMQEFLLRGNLEEADTSTNEMLHKLLKAMYKVTNKHPANFEVQMMRCEQTLLHILTEDAEEKLKEFEQDAAAAKLSATNRRRTRGQAGSKGVKIPGMICKVAGYETGYDASDESDDLGKGSDRSLDVDNEAGRLDDDHAVNASAAGTASDRPDAIGLEQSSSYKSDDDVTCSDDDDYADGVYNRVDEDFVIAPVGGHNANDCIKASSSSGCTGSAGDDSAPVSGSSNSGSSFDGSSRSNATASGAPGMTASTASGSCSNSGADGSCSSTGSSSNEPPLICRRGKRRSSKPLVPGRAPPPKRRRRTKDLTGCASVTASRVRVRGERLSVAAVAAADGGRLQQLPQLLGLVDTQMLTVVNSMAFTASFEWQAPGFVQRVRASRSLYNGTPWWDHVLFEDDSGTPPAGLTSPTKSRLGLARLLIRAVDGVRRDLVVVQLLDDAHSRPGCVLTEFGCGRRRWRIHPTTGFPSLAVVPLERLQRLEHVVPDFEDLCDRLGVYATPATVPDSPHELPLQRYFVNAFFPWTGGSAERAV